MTTVRISDAELVSLYAKGNENALQRLVLRHSPQLLGKIQAKVQDEDVAQDVHQMVWIKFINVVKAGEYKEEGKFAAFIHRVASNLCFDNFRREKRSKEISMERCGDAVLGMCDEHLNAEENALRQQWHADVKLAIKHLPDEQREVVFLRIYAGFSFKEIAEETGVGINTALGRMRYALVNLRKLLGVEI